jgi:transcription elongation factor Elf1
MESVMTQEEIDNYIARLEKDGDLDPNCKTCLEHFYPVARDRGNIWNVFAPRHKASSRCESGKHAHCSCDFCF